MQGPSQSALVFLISMAVACSVQLRARAQPTASAAASTPPTEQHVSPDVRRRAAWLTADAEAAYHANDFERASVGYQRAYALVPAPELLFNLGQCQRQLKRPERAVGYFEAYLRMAPGTPHRALILRLIAEARPATGGSVSSKVASSAPETTSSSAPASQPPAATTANAPPPQATPHPTHLGIKPLRRNHTASTSFVDDSPALYEQWWFWTLSVALVASATVTAVVLLDEEPQADPQTTLGSVRWE